MARLDNASRLRWPRRIMVSMTSLRNRLAAAPSPSSPLRSRYFQAIWKDSSSDWESEMFMSKKPTRAVRGRNRLGPKEDVAENVGLQRVQGIAHREAPIPPIASEGVVHWMRSAGPPPRCQLRRWRFGGWTGQGRCPQQAPGDTRARLADFDCLFGSDLQLFVFGRHQSAVLGRRMVNSMAPSGSSRHRSTSLM
jgi:hypothetical protein